MNLKELCLSSNQLTSLPVEIGNLLNLEELNLVYNKLTILPVEIQNILNNLIIDDTSYQINNISYDTEILIFMNLNNNLENLPLTLKTLYLHKSIDLTKHTIKLPFSCVIERY
jgi:Leucine-rich repeat (LRR) protein